MKSKLALMIVSAFVLSGAGLAVPLYAHHGFEFEYDGASTSP